MAQPMQQTADDQMQEQERPRGIFARLRDGMHWLNTPFKNQYTLGALFRYITFQEQHEERPSKLGRIAERGLFVVGALAAVALTPGGIGPLVMIGVAKLAAATVGELIQPVGRGVEGFFSFLDKKFGHEPEVGLSQRKSQYDNKVGATNGKNSLSKGVPPGFKVGTQNADMNADVAELPVGATSNLESRKVEKQPPLKPIFDNRAVNPKGKTFSVAGPRPLENYGIKPPGKH